MSRVWYVISTHIVSSASFFAFTFHKLSVVSTLSQNLSPASGYVMTCQRCKGVSELQYQLRLKITNNEGDANVVLKGSLRAG